MPRPIHLGVNVDHVATIRQARGTPYPDPVEAALQAEAAGADGITMHLREDRRHVQDADLARMAAGARTKLNLEMAATDEMRDIALRLRPADACIVPERRAELTTEGGLDVLRHRARLADLTAALTAAGIRVSLFIDPDPAQIDASADVGAPVVELHTGRYAGLAGMRGAMGAGSPAADSGGGFAADSAADSAGDSGADSAGDSAPESAGDSAADSVGDSMGDSTGESATDSSCDSASNSAGNSAGDSAGDSMVDSAAESAEFQREWSALTAAVSHAAAAGLIVNAGHGLHYANTARIAALPDIHELNIGHAIVARALTVGFPCAVGEMKRLMVEARGGRHN
ncbi:MAG: pyridoxine 5'-phosphate synthase [Gammaproteobacteria bacterium]|nr:pyridoxine 5'-phosphate synthase [Gammaproteobacteria bacterium]